MMFYYDIRKVKYTIASLLYPIKKVFFFASHKISTISAEHRVEFSTALQYFTPETHIRANGKFSVAEVTHSLPHIQSANPTHRKTA